MSDEKPKRPGGRPPKFTGEAGRIGHSLRLQPSVDIRIRSAAASNCRSIAEELEARVKSTLDGIVIFPETPNLRKALQVSAEQSGRPITLEAEGRLVESFEQDRVFGRPETYALLALLAKDIERIERDLGMSWLDAGEQPRNAVAEDLIATFSERVLWEVSLRDRMRRRAQSHREQSSRVGNPAAQVDPSLEPAVRFATPEEIATAVPAEKRPPELFDRADFDEAGGLDRGGEVTSPDPVTPAAPAPARRKRVKI